MNTIAALLAESVTLNACSDTPRLDTEILLAHSIGKPRSYLYTWPERTLTDSQTENFRRALHRRKQGEPIAHITGFRDFWNLTLSVTSDTLIPRPETETLVEQALQAGDRMLSGNAGGILDVLDLGTGTGAIALAIASEKPQWQITAVDRFPDVVALAESNRQNNEINNVTVYQSDWFENISGQFDLIVSNPPYIDGNDPHLKQGDVRFEPLSALVSGEGGLSDLCLIIEQARSYLRPDGYLLLEHGFDQGEQVRQLLAKSGYTEVDTVNDLGGNPRVTLGRFNQITINT